MSDSTEKPLLADLREEFGALGDELREMVAARWELARLELQADLSSAKRLIVVWSICGMMALTSLPLLASSLAEALDGQCGISRGGWLLILAGGLLLFAFAGGYLAWRRFRHRFVGLQETLEELREDLVWMQEKNATANRKEESSEVNNPLTGK